MAERATAMRYVGAWAVLLVLTTSTLLVSFTMHGGWDVAVALAFAVVKGLLVVWVFMHMSEEATASRIAFAAGFALLVLVIALVIGDVALRLPISVQLPVSR